MPGRPSEGGVFDGLKASPGFASASRLGFEQAVHRSGESILAAVAGAAHGGVNARLGQTLDVAQRETVRSPVAVMREAAALDGLAFAQRLLQRVERNAGMSLLRTPASRRRGMAATASRPCRARAKASTTIAAWRSVSEAACGAANEGHRVDDACPGRDIGETRDPQGVRPWRLELPTNPVKRAGGGRIRRGGGDGPASHGALQLYGAHQSRRRAAGGGARWNGNGRGPDALAADLPTRVANAADADIRLEHAAGLSQQRRIAAHPRRLLGRIGLPGGMGMAC